MVSGFSDSETDFNAWEKIIKENNRANNDKRYDRYLQSLKSYTGLIEESILVKSYLIQLVFVVDDAMIAYLKSKKYIINTSGAKAYENSIYANLRKADNLITRINMKVKEISGYLDEQSSETGEGETNADALVAIISAGLGFHVDANISLATYNEYKKTLNKQYERAKQGRSNKR